MANKEISELTAASALAGDELVHVVQSGNSRKTTVDGIGTGIFRAAATWLNARFDGSTFGLVFSTFRLTIAAALTAARTITFQDRSMTVGMVQLSTGTIPTTAATDFSVPAGVRRLTLLISGLSTNGTSVPMVQLKAGGVAETTGYTGGLHIFTTAGAVGNFSVGFTFSTGSAATSVYHMVIDILLQDANTWEACIKGGLGNTGGAFIGAGSKTLAGALDGIRLTTVGGTEVPDAGVYTLYAEY